MLQIIIVLQYYNVKILKSNQGRRLQKQFEGE